MRVFCPSCNTEGDFSPRQFRCECGAAWEPVPIPGFDQSQIDKSQNSVWRYTALLGPNAYDRSVSLGAGWTPLVNAAWEHAQAHFKLEYVSPTGSFKDRGVEIEMAFLKGARVSSVVEDSSGNAGAAMAAYAAKAGLTANIYAPDSASPVKLAQIGVYGANLNRIPGARIEATKAVLKAVSGGAVYASHAYNPVYLLGQQTFAWEIWEQSQGSLPDAVIIPVGQCGLLMGTWLGFKRLLDASVIQRIPKLFAAQPELLAPIKSAFDQGLDDIPSIETGAGSIADGLAIVKPVRSKRILQALRESNGGAVSVSEDAIRRAYFALAKQGMFVEPSSAVAAAAITRVRALIGQDASILAALTGSGMKAPILVK